jgi:quercetin dioxygenase-like cupin family protein
LICAGDTIENPITGERVTFLKTAADTDGEVVVIDTTVAPDGFVAAEHIHPYQSERFEILLGEAEFKLGKETVIAKPGDVVMVEPGTPHRFRNLSDEEGSGSEPKCVRPSRSRRSSRRCTGSPQTARPTKRACPTRLGSR